MIFHTFLSVHILRANDRKIELKNIVCEHLSSHSCSLKSYFPSLSTTEMEWEVLPRNGPCGEENIKNANLTSTKKNIY